MRGSTQIKQNGKYHSGKTGDFSDEPGELARIR